MGSIIKLKSKADTTNPKDLLGVKKVSLTKIPAVAVAWGNMAMMDGAAKYGPYNWREKSVIASIYIDAAKRHLDTWFEGQENANDSLVHHLGHAIACCAILLDSQFTGNLVDDRPLSRDEQGNILNADRFAKFLEQLSNIIKEKSNMPAKSRAQEKFIMANANKFGGKKKAVKEWLEPVKGKKLPNKVKKAK